MLIIFFGALWCVFAVAVSSASKSGQNDHSVGLFPSLPVGIVETDNALCREHSRIYYEHLKNLSLWAYEMRDSTAQSVTGILRGNIAQFGQFDECLTSDSPFPTQYCLATIIAVVPSPNPPRNQKDLTYLPNESVLRKIYDKKDPSQQPKNVVLKGWCVPASCTALNLKTYLNEYLKTVNFPLKNYNVSYFSQIEENNCQKEGENKDLDQVDVSFGLVCVILILIVFVSTLYDNLRDYSNEKLVERSPLTSLVLTFSLKNNLKKLPYFEDGNPALTILYGMRVICICMIIMDHRFGTHLSSGILNFDLVENQYRSPVGTMFFHGDVFVDSFFILSGLLGTYCLLIQYDKRFINPGVIVFMRYIRLTPLYAFVIFYYATYFKYSGNGPMWKTIIYPEVEDCRNNWWTNILYINNYVNVDKICMVHSWYLPCDFHYFMIAVLLCIIIYKNKRAGLIILSMVTIVSIILPSLIIYLHELSAVIYFYPDFLRFPKQQQDFLMAYTKSHTRASPYFIGMIAGYLYYRMRESEKCLKRVYSHIILLGSLLLMIASIVTGTIFYDPHYEYTALGSALYASLHRVAWSVGTVGVLYVASYGHARFIYNFLSWKPWIPISKLVYGAYLTHMQFQMRAVARKGGSDFVTYFDIISYALSDIVLAFATSLVLYLAIEAPFRNIFTLLLVPSKNKKRKSKAIENQESVSEVTCDSHL